MPKSGTLVTVNNKFKYGTYDFPIKVTDPFGNSADKSMTVKNSLQPFRVESSSPSNGGTRVPVGSDIVLDFNKGLNSVSPYSIRLEDIMGQSLEFLYEMDNDILRIIPKEPFVDGGIYTLNLAWDSAYGADNSRLEKDYTVSFTTGDDISRLAGSDRYSTSLEIANYINENFMVGNEVVIATGDNFPDALSAVPDAAYDAMLFAENSITGKKGFEAESMDKEGTVLNDQWTQVLKVQDGFVYYTNLEDNKMYRMKSDGSGKTCLNQEASGKIGVEAGFVYYTNANDGNKIYRVSVDGINNTKVSDDSAGEINVSSGWIYYSNTNDSDYLYKVNVDGTGRQKLSSNNASKIVADSYWVYYFSRNIYSGTGTVCKTRVDGSWGTPIVT